MSESSTSSAKNKEKEEKASFKEKNKDEDNTSQKSAQTEVVTNDITPTSQTVVGGIVFFKAEVVKVLGDKVLVEPLADTREAQNGKLYVPKQITGDEQRKFPNVSEGDIIEIYYDSIQETYPAQIEHVYNVILVEN